MKSFFSLVPPPQAGVAPVVRESAPPSHAADEGILRGPKRKGSMTKNVLISLLFAALAAALVAGGVWSQKKWNLYQKFEDKFLGPPNFKKMQDAAVELRNELFHWRQTDDPTTKLQQYMTSSQNLDLTLGDEFYSNFMKDPIDLFDHEKRRDAWDHAIAYYSGVADLGALPDSAQEFLKCRLYLVGLGFKDEKPYDPSNWDELFNIDMKALKKFAGQYKGPEGDMKKLEFYVEHIPTLISLRKQYISQRSSSIYWLNKKHADVGKAHPGMDKAPLDPNSGKGEGGKGGKGGKGGASDDGDSDDGKGAGKGKGEKEKQDQEKKEKEDAAEKEKQAAADKERKAAAFKQQLAEFDDTDHDSDADRQDEEYYTKKKWFGFARRAYVRPDMPEDLQDEEAKAAWIKAQDDLEQQHNEQEDEEEKEFLERQAKERAQFEEERKAWEEMTKATKKRRAARAEQKRAFLDQHEQGARGGDDS